MSDTTNGDLPQDLPAASAAASLRMCRRSFMRGQQPTAQVGPHRLRGRAAGAARRPCWRTATSSSGRSAMLRDRTKEVYRACKISSSTQGRCPARTQFIGSMRNSNHYSGVDVVLLCTRRTFGPCTSRRPSAQKQFSAKAMAWTLRAFPPRRLARGGRGPVGCPWSPVSAGATMSRCAKPFAHPRRRDRRHLACTPTTTGRPLASNERSA